MKQTIGNAVQEQGDFSDENERARFCEIYTRMCGMCTNYCHLAFDQNVDVDLAGITQPLPEQFTSRLGETASAMRLAA